MTVAGVVGSLSLSAGIYSFTRTTAGTVVPVTGPHLVGWTNGA